ncbi:MAG: alpha/beta hydrolase [Burkholderiaceae bacterium]|nr:alpha/beta hydrolase [Burkholderiaceae bacterium]
MNDGITIKPEFLEGFANGPRFAVWFTPSDSDPIGAVLCLQPMGEEMSHSRRVLALQARRLARLGWAVLMIDLYGCGDSPGDSDDATLGRWRADLLRATMHVRERATGSTILWGTRVGALLAVDISAALVQLVDALILWAPPPLGCTWLASWRRLGSQENMARVHARARARRDQARTAHRPAGAAAGDISRPPSGAAGDLSGPPTDWPSTRFDTEPSPDTVIAAFSRPATVRSAPIMAVGRPDDEFEVIGGARYLKSLISDIGELSLAPNRLSEAAGEPPAVLMVEMRAESQRSMVPSKMLSVVAERWLDAGYLLTARTVHARPFWSSVRADNPVEVFEATEQFIEGLR